MLGADYIKPQKVTIKKDRESFREEIGHKDVLWRYQDYCKEHAAKRPPWPFDLGDFEIEGVITGKRAAKYYSREQYFIFYGKKVVPLTSSTYRECDDDDSGYYSEWGWQHGTDTDTLHTIIKIRDLDQAIWNESFLARDEEPRENRKWAYFRVGNPNFTLDEIKAITKNSHCSDKGDIKIEYEKEVEHYKKQKNTYIMGVIVTFVPLYRPGETKLTFSLSYLPENERKYDAIHNMRYTDRYTLDRAQIREENSNVWWPSQT